MLNKVFHHKDRGSGLGTELLAGLGMFFLSVCGLFVNMQLIAKLSTSGEYAQATAQQIAVNGEYYALTWFLSMIIAFAGSLLIGIVAGLPLVQVSGLGTSVVLVSMIGLETGLNYYNLLFVCFVSSIVYTVLWLIPGLRDFIFRALPRPVRKALPAASGILICCVALQLTGVTGLTSSSISIYGAGTNGLTENATVQLFGGIALGQYSYSTDAYHPLLMIGMIAVLFTAALFILIRRRSGKPYLVSLMGGTLFFLLVSILRVNLDWKTKKFNLDSLWGRLWMMGSEDAMQTHIATMKKTFSFTRVLEKGSDFSAYTEAGGNVVLLFAVGILTFLLLNMYESQAVLETVGSDAALFDTDSSKSIRNAMICNGLANIAAALIGTTPVQIAPASVAGEKDGARTGIASIVASVGMAVSIFFWIVPFLFTTALSYSIQFNLYGHYGTVMQLMSESGMAVADAVMVFVGLAMIAESFRQLDLKQLGELAPAMATVLGAFASSNLAAGAAIGTIAFTLANLLPEKRRAAEEAAAEMAADEAEERGTEIVLTSDPAPAVTPENLVWTAVSAALLVLMAMYY